MLSAVAARRRSVSMRLAGPLHTAEGAERQQETHASHKSVLGLNVWRVGDAKDVLQQRLPETRGWFTL